MEIEAEQAGGLSVPNVQVAWIFQVGVELQVLQVVAGFQVTAGLMAWWRVDH